MADYPNIFDADVTNVINSLVEQYNEKSLTDKEYPLALLNAYGMMMVSQLKRQADELFKINEGLSHIYERLTEIHEQMKPVIHECSSDPFNSEENNGH